MALSTAEMMDEFVGLPTYFIFFLKSLFPPVKWPLLSTSPFSYYLPFPFFSIKAICISIFLFLFISPHIPPPFFIFLWLSLAILGFSAHPLFILRFLDCHLLAAFPRFHLFPLICLPTNEPHIHCTKILHTWSSHYLSVPLF